MIQWAILTHPCYLAHREARRKEKEREEVERKALKRQRAALSSLKQLTAEVGGCCARGWWLCWAGGVAAGQVCVWHLLFS